jgi:hypothetical protein
MEIKKNGEYNNIDFKDIAPNTSVVVEKTYPEGKMFESQFGPRYRVGLKYQDTVVSTFMTQAQHKNWASLPLGKVNVKSVPKQIEFDGKNGTKSKKWVNLLEFSELGDSSPITKESVGKENIVLPENHLKLLKYYVDGGKNKEEVVKFEGSEKPIREILPEVVLDHPERFLK